MLKFPDGTQVRVSGLDEIMEDLYREGKQANQETAEEILDRLEKGGNYIPPSARQDYRRIIIKVYEDYISEHKK